jgi:hypothetical protein
MTGSVKRETPKEEYGTKLVPDWHHSALQLVKVLLQFKYKTDVRPNMHEGNCQLISQ